MNALQEQFGDDFVILGFPCNQFGLQEPGGSPQEILNGIKYVRPGGGLVPNFPMFSKTEVNGPNAHPMFSFLRSVCPCPREGFNEKARLYYDGLLNSDIRWNWEKFLIDADGIPRLRFDYKVEPNALIPHIQALIDEKKHKCNN